MNICFTKMQGLGNDFIVLEDFANALSLTAGQIRRLADRRLGIGCDQLLLLQASDLQQAAVRYRIFNADGGEVEQCGNGLRCIARYLYDRGLHDDTTLLVETAAGIVRAELLADGQVKVAMGIPVFRAEAIPLSVAELHNPVAIALADGGDEVTAMVLSLGNPHAVLSVADTASAEVERLGTAIQRHGLFPAGVNVGFMQVIDRQRIRLRVYERGVGETLACGTGACAATIAGILNGDLDNEVTVTLQGGDLQVSWQGEGEPVWMIGPAIEVYTGQIAI